MNIKYITLVRRFVQTLIQFISDLGWTAFSTGMVLVLSSFRAARTGRKNKAKDGRFCCVLGNGPSLKDALDNNEVEYDNCDVVCVNMFCKSDYFNKIKPRYYYLMDKAYFIPATPRHHQLIKDLVEGLNKVDWEMNLVVPVGMPCDFLLKDLNNTYVKIERINGIWVKGFRGFRHLCYKRQYAIPRCDNVLGVVLTMAVSKGYQKVFLYGADHSWTRDLYVDDDNVVCYGDRHVYHKELQIVKMNHPLHEELTSFATVFKAHLTINDYAKECGCEIINCTKGSFIDAYTRKLNNN